MSNDILFTTYVVKFVRYYIKCTFCFSTFLTLRIVITDSLVASENPTTVPSDYHVSILVVLYPYFIRYTYFIFFLFKTNRNITIKYSESGEVYVREGYHNSYSQPSMIDDNAYSIVMDRVVLQKKKKKLYYYVNRSRTP